MDDLMKYRYNFVLEKRMESSMEDQEYRACLQEIQQREDNLQAQMNEEQWQELYMLLHGTAVQNAMENERIFQEAPGLGRELRALI